MYVFFIYVDKGSKGAGRWNAQAWVNEGKPFT